MPLHYEDRTVDDLHEAAVAKGIKGQSKMTKAELVAALRGEGDPNDVMVAIQSGSAEIDGVEVSFERDRTRVARGSALAKAQPHAFAQADEGLAFEIEQATAAPGEKRG